ncbi:hypothetical protein RRG08_025328 [Elysia crispata]|uniref:Uncharacterized protein n=1 Tax=Elysia crispata TaxID=231223 RepID=A0AAE1DVC4_9GAST|nr:hypothetical protein RRG08_025328 [Elysia crispata]
MLSGSWYVGHYNLLFNTPEEIPNTGNTMQCYAEGVGFLSNKTTGERAIVQPLQNFLLSSNQRYQAEKDTGKAHLVSQNDGYIYSKQMMKFY